MSPRGNQMLHPSLGHLSPITTLWAASSYKCTGFSCFFHVLLSGRLRKEGEEEGPFALKGSPGEAPLCDICPTALGASFLLAPARPPPTPKLEPWGGVAFIDS